MDDDTTSMRCPRDYVRVAIAFNNIQHLMETDREWHSDTAACRKVLLVIGTVVIRVVDVVLVLDDNVMVLGADMVCAAVLAVGDLNRCCWS